jgi:D-alanyl-D-alanine carboxypeptidase/D-alanyl-D-alanine-endopeptidase (penicillin-binding protein 4)
MKLVTAAAALDLLGPSYTFQTSLYGDVHDDQVAQLGLKGTGDPSLGEAQLWRLANALAARGVKRVGEIVVDQSHFDEQFVPPAFEQQPNEWAPFRAPVSAIALDRNTLTLNVMPTEAKSNARVWLEPKGVASVEGSIRTLAPGKGQQARFDLQSKDGALVAQVGGHLAAGLPRQRFTKRVDDPRLMPGLNLRAHLLDLGLVVGKVQLGSIGSSQRITFTASPPLGELIKELGKHSDNFYAEMLFKSLAISESAEPRSFATAAKVVSDWLSKHTASPPQTRIVNGSGLFDANRVSARTLAKLLAWAYREPRIRDEFVPHLAIGGIDGTLRSRFTNPRSQGRVRAKTGTLRDTVSLSGYAVPEGTSAPVVFAFIVTGIRGQHAAIRTRIDGVVQQLIE